MQGRAKSCAGKLLSLHMLEPRWGILQSAVELKVTREKPAMARFSNNAWQEREDGYER